jgi:hypothetical protein
MCHGRYGCEEEAMLTALLVVASMTPADEGCADVVLVWNEAALQAIRDEQTPPPLAARNLAMVHVAVHDAVNSVRRTHEAFRFEARLCGPTSPETAAAVAAHRVLLDLYPNQAECLNATLRCSMRDLDPGERTANGVALGHAVAEKVLAWRAADGETRRVAYRPRSGPGLWQPTPPRYKPALLPQWSQAKCFAMRSGDQFRPAGPPALDSAAYEAAYREVEALGRADSRVRTREQTEIARFWEDGEGTVTPPGHWNRIAQGVARDRRLSVEENARLFALLNVALADAGIACWDCKFKYDFWRPVQAIQEADRDWVPLLETPPFPAYSSGHSTFSGAAAAALAAFFGTDAVRFRSTSEGLPCVTRSYRSFSEAAAEAGQSRIYGGIHWQFDNTEGLHCGREVGEYVSKYYMQPRRLPPAAEPPPPGVRLLPPVPGDELVPSSRR